MSRALELQLSSAEAELLHAYRNMTDDDREMLVSFAGACARDNPRKITPRLSLVANIHSATRKEVTA
jgi:hypothetical protein